MDWKLQLLISFILPLVCSILTYLAAAKKSKIEVEKVKISCDNEIQKIREESEKEIKRIKLETDEQIRIKITESDINSKANEDNIKNIAMGKFFDEFMKNPQKSAQNLKEMQNIAKMFEKK